MTWRIHRDESHYSNAQKVAWEIALPEHYLPIITSDYDKAKAIEKALVKWFSPQALASAAKRLPPKPYEPYESE